MRSETDSRRHADPLRIDLVCGTTHDPRNAILEYSYLMAEALRGQGAEAAVRETTEALPDSRGTDVVVLQYNPFLYGRWGIAPGLVARIASLRVRVDRPRVALMVHETFMDDPGWRSRLMGAGQRAQLAALFAVSDIVFSSTQAWAEMLRSWRPRRPVLHLPVGSNIPDRRGDRSRARESLGVDSADVVLAAFGTGHPSRRLEYVAAATNAVAQHRGPTLLLNLGANAPTVSNLVDDVYVHTPGALPAAEVAAVLAAADVFLAPFIDGITTRRGSVMAALRAGIAVVATSTSATDDVLRNDPGLTLLPVGQIEAFADAAVQLSEDGNLRAAAASAAVELYESRFDWPVLAQLLLEHLPRGEKTPDLRGLESET